MANRGHPYSLRPRKTVVNQIGCGPKRSNNDDDEDDTLADYKPKRQTTMKKYMQPKSKKQQEFTPIEPEEYWDPKTATLTFEEWVKDKWGDRDPAMGFLYNKYWPMPPLQCKHCMDNGRFVEYDVNTDTTRIVYNLCQACRYRGLKLAFMEYKFFKADEAEAQKKHNH